MSYPLIGVSTFQTQSQAGLPIIAATEAYIRALSRAGACPVLVPLGLPEDLLSETLQRLDGLLFTGGGDIHPERYGNTIHPKVSNINLERDRVEIHLLQQAVERGLPFLGICRGLQLVNVALGGSLYEDLLEQRPGSLRHDYDGDYPREYLAHAIQVKTGSRIGQILGKTCVLVNSLHHQGIRHLAPGLRAAAHAPDGVIEGVELAGHRFGLAVQWHPEWLPDDPTMTALFHEFARAASPVPYG